MTRTLQIDKYQLCQLMDEFTATVEDENSIYYNLKIPYSSWTLLKKVSNWKGLISVEYTDKELNFSNNKETVTLVNNSENFPFIDFFYGDDRYTWKCKKTDIVDNPINNTESVLEQAKNRILSMGLDTTDMIEIDGYYVVENDILINKDSLFNVPQTRQYSATYFV